MVGEQAGGGLLRRSSRRAEVGGDAAGKVVWS